MLRPWLLRAARRLVGTALARTEPVSRRVAGMVSGIAIGYPAPRGAHSLTGKRAPDVVVGESRLYEHMHPGRFTLLDRTDDGALARLAGERFLDHVVVVRAAAAATRSWPGSRLSAPMPTWHGQATRPAPNGGYPPDARFCSTGAVRSPPAIPPWKIVVTWRTPRDSKNWRRGSPAALEGHVRGVQHPRCRSQPHGYDRPVPARLHVTDDDEANALIASDPMALLGGFVLDQQVTVEKAFAGPPGRGARAKPRDFGRLGAQPFIRGKRLDG